MGTKRRGFFKNLQLKGTIKSQNTIARILIWNIAGLRNKDNDFWTYVRKHDVVFLMEIWVEKSDISWITKKKKTK